MNDQDKKTPTPDEPAKSADQSADKPSTTDSDSKPSGSPLKELNDKPVDGKPEDSSATSSPEETLENPIDHALEVPSPESSDVQELLDAKIEKLRSQASEAQHLPWWQKMIPGRKRDMQLAEIKSGYEEVLELIRSMRENLDAQVVGQKKLVEFMSELPGVAEGLRHMGEAATQQKEIMGALKTQMEANAKQNGTIASSMDKFNGTLHSMDDTTRQILQGARQTENSLKSLLERSERRLMLMTSLVIVILVAVGITLVVISQNGGFGGGAGEQDMGDQASPVVEPLTDDDGEPEPLPEEPAVNVPDSESPDSEPVATEEGEDPADVEPVEDGETPAEESPLPEDGVEESDEESDEEVEQEAVPEDADAVQDESPQDADSIESEESPETAPSSVVGEETDAGEDDVEPEETDPEVDIEAEGQETGDSVDSTEEPKKKQSWLTRNLFGKKKDKPDEEPPIEEQEEHPSEENAGVTPVEDSVEETGAPEQTEEPEEEPSEEGLENTSEDETTEGAETPEEQLEE